MRTARERTAAVAASCAKGEPEDSSTAATLTVGTDNPAYPPWYAGGTPKGSSWKINDPNNGKGFEPAVAYAVAKQLGFSHGAGEVGLRAVQPLVRARPEAVRLRHQPDLVHAGAREGRLVQLLVLRREPGARRAQGHADLEGAHGRRACEPYKLGAQLGTTSYTYINDTIKPSKQPSVFPQNAAAIQALKNRQIDGLVVDLPTAFYVTAVQVPNSTILGQFPAETGGEHFGMVFAKGNSLAACVNGALATLKSSGTLASRSSSSG